MAGYFSGEVEVTWLTHEGADRDMKLLKPFSFVDASNGRWDFPAGAVINGASIPQVFWTSFGPPFVGDYRRASVVHDYFCEVRNRPSKAVHRMFREACIAGGVSSSRAGAMYLALRTFGKNWTVLTGALAVPGVNRWSEGAQIDLVTTMDLDQYAVLRKWIEENDPSVEDIDARANAGTKAFPALSISTPEFGKVPTG